MFWVGQKGYSGGTVDVFNDCQTLQSPFHKTSQFPCFNSCDSLVWLSIQILFHSWDMFVTFSCPPIRVQALDIAPISNILQSPTATVLRSNTIGMRNSLRFVNMTNGVCIYIDNILEFTSHVCFYQPNPPPSLPLPPCLGPYKWKVFIYPNLCLTALPIYLSSILHFIDKICFYSLISDWIERMQGCRVVWQEWFVCSIDHGLIGTTENNHQIRGRK